MEPWLERALVAAGRLDRDGVRREAQIRTCRRCRQWTLVGLSHDRVSVALTCDPADLDALGEARAILAGRWTCSIRGKHLNPRDQFHIRSKRPRPFVVAEHECGNKAVPTQGIVEIFLPPKRKPLPEKPPF